LKFYTVFLLIVFASFLVTPMIVTISGGEQDIASFFSMNEEENSNTKIEVVSDYNSEKSESTNNSIQFLKKQQPVDGYLHNYANVLLEINSPPPRLS